MKNEFDYLNDVKMDFSIYDDCKLSDMEREKMKNIMKKTKKINRGKIAALAACVAGIAIFSQTALAKDLLVNIIKTFSTGHNTFSLIEPSDVEIGIPKEALGMIFNEKGKEIKAYKEGEVLYDENGDKIEDFGAFMRDKVGIYEVLTEDGKGGTIRVSYAPADDDPLDFSRREGYPIIRNIDEINGYLSFDAKLPDYLPDGYSFYGASAYGNDYLFVYYMNQENGQWFSLHERIINNETAYESGTDGTIEEVAIHGQKAVMMDERSIAWESGKISIDLSGRGFLNRTELIKVAESIQK